MKQKEGRKKNKKKNYKMRWRESGNLDDRNTSEHNVITKTYVKRWNSS